MSNDEKRTTSRVFVANQPRRNKQGVIYNIKPAAAFGDIIHVFRADEPVPSNMPNAIDLAFERMSDFSSGDYLVWAGGDPLAAFITGAVAVEKTDGNFSYLKYEKTKHSDEEPAKGFYSPFPLDFGFETQD